MANIVMASAQVHHSVSFEVVKNGTEALPPPQHVVAAAFGHDASLATVYNGEVCDILYI